jgi:hypothetical protein
VVQDLVRQRVALEIQDPGLETRQPAVHGELHALRGGELHHSVTPRRQPDGADREHQLVLRRRVTEREVGALRERGVVAVSAHLGVERPRIGGGQQQDEKREHCAGMQPSHEVRSGAG